jgi:hypothetical protein
VPIVEGSAPAANAPQPSRPPVDLAAFTVPDSFIPAGWTRFGDDRIGVTNIVTGTKDPQAALNFLNSIGFLAGRQQNWSGPLAQNRYPTLFVQNLVFGTDAGASRFLHSPVFGDKLCIKPEQAPLMGQETAGFSYQYVAALNGGGTGPFDGHSDLVRCGRIVVGITGAGAPGQVTKSSIDDLAKRVVDELKKSQPC